MRLSEQKMCKCTIAFEISGPAEKFLFAQFNSFCRGYIQREEKYEKVSF